MHTIIPPFWFENPGNRDSAERRFGEKTITCFLTNPELSKIWFCNKTRLVEFILVPIDSPYC